MDEERRDDCPVFKLRLKEERRGLNPNLGKAPTKWFLLPTIIYAKAVPSIVPLQKPIKVKSRWVVEDAH